MTIKNTSPNDMPGHQANSILMRWVSELEQRSREANALLELNGLLGGASSRLEAFDVAASALERLFPGWSGFVGALEEDNRTVTILGSWGLDRFNGQAFLRADCRALSAEDPAPVGVEIGSKPCPHTMEGHHVTQQICVPVQSNGHLFGLISLHLPMPVPGEPHLTSPAMTDSRQNLLGVISEQLGLTLREISERRSQGITYPARPLADFNDRLYLEEMLERELQKARMANTSICLVYFCLENLGGRDHPSLDTQSGLLLKKVGAMLASNIRKEDSAAVAGSNLFLVILKNTDPQQAMGVATRIQSLVAGLNDPIEELSYPPPAIGLALFESDSREVPSPLAEAENAYRAALAEGSGKIHLSVC